MRVVGQNGFFAIVLGSVLSAGNGWAGGWYLMRPGPKADLHVISPKWETIQAYDSAEDCEAVKAETLKILRARADRHPEDMGAQVGLGMAFVSQCVSTDDSRLKGD
jgi:hypothetical protein